MATRWFHSLRLGGKAGVASLPVECLLRVRPFQQNWKGSENQTNGKYGILTPVIETFKQLNIIS